MKLQSLNLRRVIASSATLAIVLGAAAGLLAPANASSTGCDSASCTADFAYSGATESFTVPSGVTALTVAVSGASGGALSFYPLPGGRGATVSGVLPVTPGQQLTVLVGEAGVGNGGATFGGGGATASNAFFGSGGGGSFVFDAAGLPLMAAGGGGGASNLVQPPAGTSAGAGATSTGGSGAGGGYDGESQATGGSQTAAGVRGSNQFAAGTDGSGPATAAAPGQGGSGGSAFNGNYTGGGGGGGYFGGGGGAYAQSGAGGSGYADPSVTSLSSTDGANAGNGAVSLSWALQAATVALSQTPSAGSAAGDSVILSAAISGPSGTPTGTVEFQSNGSTIAGCSAQPVTSGTATCTTTTLAVGTDTLLALYSGDTVYAAGNSVPTTYPVAYPPLSVTTTSLLSGQVNAAYSVVLHGTGGLAPYSWDLASGALPTGLTLSSDRHDQRHSYGRR